MTSILSNKVPQRTTLVTNDTSEISTTANDNSIAKYITSSKNSNSPTYSFSLKNDSIDFNKEKMLKKHKSYVDTTLAKAFIDDLTQKIEIMEKIEKTEKKFWVKKNNRLKEELQQMKDLRDKLQNPTAMKKYEEFFLQNNQSITNDYIAQLETHMKQGYNENIIFEKANAISRAVNLAIDNTIRDLKLTSISDKEKQLVFYKVITHFSIDENTKQKVNPKAASLSAAHHVANNAYNSVLTQSKIAKLSNNDPSLITAQSNAIVTTLGNQIINDAVTQFFGKEEFDLDKIYEDALVVTNKILYLNSPTSQPIQDNTNNKRKDASRLVTSKLSIPNSHSESTDV